MVSPAVFFHPDGYSTANARVMGRRVAGRDFLRAHFEAAAEAGVERLTCHGANRDLAVMFAKAGREHGYQGKVRLVALEDVGPLRDDGVLYVPDPSLGIHARFRERHGRGNYSISGVIHTLASGETLDMLADLTTDPVAEWDALVCTSRAGRAVVEEVIARREAWLTERVGATRFTRPELPVIPLGVHVEDYAGLRHDKAQARAALGIPDGAKVVVFVGRLSLHAKAHPLPLYLALDKAAKAVGPIVLLECGSFGDGATAKAFGEMRAHFPRLLGGVVGGETAASEDQKLACLAAADVFTSLADNVQETFGLSVIEAMAAGLPVVVSDWDGYKDTVRDGVDGFRVPTSLPAVGAADSLITAYERTLLDYDHYVGFLSQHCVVDIDRAAEAFVALLGNPSLGATMGSAAEERAKDFAWTRVYRRYQELWTELSRRRIAATTVSSVNTVATSRKADPTNPTSHRAHAEALYASFPSRFTSLETMWTQVAGADRSVLGLSGVRAALEGVIDGETASGLLSALEAGPMSASALARSDDEARVRSGQMHALAKYGLVRDAPEG